MFTFEKIKVISFGQESFPPSLLLIEFCLLIYLWRDCFVLFQAYFQVTQPPYPAAVGLLAEDLKMLKRLSGTNFRWFEFCNEHEQILRAVKNFNGPFITPRCGGTYPYGFFKSVPPPPPGQKHSNRRILCFYQNQTVDILFVLVSFRKGSRIELKFPLPLVTLIYITKDLLNLLSFEGEERSLTCFRLTLR